MAELVNYEEIPGWGGKGTPENPFKITDFDSRDMRKVLEGAKQAWSFKCQEYFDKYGDVGSCTLGSGIDTYVKLPGKRKATLHTLISVHEVCRWQGSCIWEDSVREIVKVLADKYGISCFYNPGMLD